MSDSKTPDSSPQPAAAAAAAASPPHADNDAVSGLERAGTVLMAVAIGTVVVILLDFAFNGRILGPLFARLPAPAPASAPGDGGRDQGDDDTAA